MKHCVLLIFCLGTTLTSFAQQTDSSLSVRDQAAFAEAVEKKLSKLDRKVRLSTTRMLDKISRQEYRIYKRIRKYDSAAAKEFISASGEKLRSLKRKADINPTDSSVLLKQYIPAFDTIKASLSFLTALSPVNANSAGSASATLRRFETRLQVANEIKREVNQRRKQLMAELSRFSLAKELKAYSKTAYYYQQEVTELKAMLKDRRKAEKKAIAILSKNEKFKSFIRENGMLAKMFGLPNGEQVPQGLQTRQSVSALILQRFAASGSNPQDQVKQQISAAQQSIDDLKKKLNAAKQKNSSDIDMPTGFQPNTQKKKSILNRLEYGVSFQMQKLNSYFPATADIALSLGYKLNDISTIGIGAAYKVGLGDDWNKIEFSNEGIGIRSFLDVKLKGGLWLTGGYEQNHFKRFRTIQQLSSLEQWNQSALLGLTRKIRLSKQKNGKVQLLYDFFYDKNKINAQPLVFRIGYNF